MVNPETKQRELAYIVTIDEIKSIPNYDRVEYARTNGWWVIVRKNQFKVGDLAIFFEIDSRVPATKPFAFLERRHYKIKTQKMCGVISQGLLMSFEDFGWDKDYHKLNDCVTQELGVTYAISEDNNRKGKMDKYKIMVARRSDIFKQNWARWMMQRGWGRVVMFALFGKKRDKQTAFPSKFPFVHKTDEDRIENLPWILDDQAARYIKTTKVDGTSGTFILEKKLFGYEYYVCSRNVRQLTPEQGNFHSQDENVYWEADEKYHIKDFLKQFLHGSAAKYVALQGEIYGCSNNGVKIQGDPHKIGELRIAGFNLIDSKVGRWDSVQAARFCGAYGIPWVPIVDENYQVPQDMEEFKLSADGPCEIKGSSGLREGYVYRKVGDPNFSFKNVSRKYLLKHGE